VPMAGLEQVGPLNIIGPVLDFPHPCEIKQC
jgi:hypothetical protein